MAKVWDDLMKLLIGANPQDFVSLLLPGATFLHERSQELKSRTIIADLLYTVLFEGKKMVMHTEIQRRRDRKMGRRLWEYNALTTITSGLPVCSFVVYLKKDGKVVESPYVIKLPNGQGVHIFYFYTIKLWEIPTEVLMQAGRAGLLPLLPLTKDGRRREVVEEMITGLKAADKADLLPLGYAFAALVFNKEDDQDWLKRRFAMLKDVLEESWAYQEMMEQGLVKGLAKGLAEGEAKGLAEGEAKGLAEGEAKGLGQAVVSFVQKRFPDLLPLAEQQTVVLKDTKVLQEMLDGLFSAQTPEEAKKLLSMEIKPKRKTRKSQYKGVSQEKNR